MKKLSLLPLLVTLFTFPASADTAEELDKWFRDGYAALYLENAWDKADEFAQYFTNDIAYRSDDGLEINDVNSFVIDSLDTWRSDGWEGTDVASLKTKLLNASTALFKIKWHDRNKDGSSTYECGWYFADKIDGEWLLSQYIVMECAE
ncbi:MAG: hypothetical protein ACR2QS_10345 [Woeseiaceae bacterium]